MVAISLCTAFLNRDQTSLGPQTFCQFRARTHALEVLSVIYSEHTALDRIRYRQTGPGHHPPGIQHDEVELETIRAGSPHRQVREMEEALFSSVVVLAVEMRSDKCPDQASLGYLPWRLHHIIFFVAPWIPQ